MASLAPRHGSTRRVAIGVGLAGVVILALVGLNPQPAQQAFNGPLFDFLLWAELTPGYAWITFPLLESVANVALFIPVGILAFLVIPRRLWPLSLLVGPVLSTGIELAQWLVLPGRTGDVWDVVANTAGAALGVGIAAAVSLPLAARRARKDALSRTPS